jgi:predicted RND superfamily exporter protein
MSGLKRRWFVVVLAALAAVGAWRLQFDVEVLNLLPRQLPEVQGLAIYNEHFANARELILSVQAENPATAEFAAAAIATTLRADSDRVAEAHWQPPWREHPEAAAAMLAHTWIHQPPEIFNQLVERLTPRNAEPELRAARTRLTTTFSPEEFARLGFDPLGFTQLPGKETRGTQFGRGDEMFAAADGRFRLVFIQATSDLADYRECAVWFDAIREQIEELRQTQEVLEEVTVRYTGRPAFVSEISGGMQSDMTRSVVGTGLIVAAIFWWAHRRFKPMGWLMLLMAMAIGLTLAFGGLIYGPLNVISVGFAAILLGLAADYGMVLYQEWREQCTHGQGSQVGSARRGVRWSALTTSSAFLMLNLSGLPGLSQLGTLVAIGVVVGALLMLRLYLSPFVMETARAPVPHPAGRTSRFLDGAQSKAAVPITAVLVAGMLGVLWNGLPELNRSADSLRPRISPAYAALDEIEARMQRSEVSLWLILSGADEADVERALTRADATLSDGVERGWVDRYTLPTEIWPRPANAAANRRAATQLLASWPALRSTVLGNGFTTNALTLADGVMAGFDAQLASPQAWPDNVVARWSLGQFTARTPTNLFVMGLVYPTSDADSPAALAKALDGPAWLVGWERMGQALAELVKRDLTHVFIPTLLIVILCLSLAFRGLVEVVLSLVALGFSLAALCSLMIVAGWSWNLLNMMALPLLLGVGVDYSIHTLLAMRRYAGDLARTRRSVGRALFLCAATTATGFGSLSLSNNAGLASLGQVCAAGVLITYLVATVLLPGWWLACGARRRALPLLPATSASPNRPSSFYGARCWQAGLWIARRLPRPLLLAVAHTGAALYRKVARHRFDVVTGNLHPVCRSDATTETTANRLFEQFARKITDLWIYESGGAIDHMFGELTGLEHLLAAQTPGRGLLLVTPHLGNWEFGAPLLTRQGVAMQVVTLAEPDDALTRLRQESRSRWNIETVVIGADPFGFVELIRRLENGAAVALLVDRPAAATATDVELFGRPFQASSAPAELARATGCAILPVYVTYADGHYNATALAPVDYDRTSLRDPAARHQLTQKIARAFEPAIRQHADQWYHFVPIWPETEKPQDPAADI